MQTREQEPKRNESVRIARSPKIWNRELSTDFMVVLYLTDDLSIIMVGLLIFKT